jgi:hypothetical protein
MQVEGVRGAKGASNFNVTLPHAPYPSCSARNMKLAMLLKSGGPSMATSMLKFPFVSSVSKPSWASASIVSWG